MEATANVRCLLATYAHLVDTARADEIADLFSFDAVLRVSSAQLSGEVTVREGQGQIRRHFHRFPYGPFRHHLTDIRIHVGDNSTSAHLTSCFFTSRPGSLKSGLYEIDFETDAENRWSIKRMTIASAGSWLTV